MILLLQNESSLTVGDTRKSYLLFYFIYSQAVEMQTFWAQDQASSSPILTLASSLAIMSSYTHTLSQVHAVSHAHNLEDRGGGDTKPNRDMITSQAQHPEGNCSCWGQGVVGSMGGSCSDAVNSLNVVHLLKTLSRLNTYVSKFPIFYLIFFLDMENCHSFQVINIINISYLTKRQSMKHGDHAP